MALDPRTPIIVGAGQFMQRPEVPTDAIEPVAMMAAAVEAAVDDAGARALLADVSSIVVVSGAWPYNDPAKIIADMVGANNAVTHLSPTGGNTPQSLVNRSAVAIQAGEQDIVVLAGGEGINSRRRARKAGETIPYTDDKDVPPAPVMGTEVTMNNKIESALGIDQPINIYPIFESAIRHANGETIAEHRARIAKLWEGFNKVAVENPYAWIRTPMSADEIREASDNNRMIGFPYTKSMNSNWNLDQAAALILMSVEKAEALGINRDRWIFPHAGTDAHDTYYVSNRGDLHSSPAIRVAGRELFSLAGTGADDIAHVDLYSCFPSAVQIGATEIGLGLDRQLTVTGGLPFAGGPLNNYVMHSIATMVNVLRNDPGQLGLVSANGGYVTKHALGIYSTEPPAAGFKHADVQDEVDKFPSVELAEGHTGPATVEGYTVMHGHEGPARALAACLTPQGQRTWAVSEESVLMNEMIASEYIGTAVNIAEGGVLQPA